jgi:hypothetical protein
VFSIVVVNTMPIGIWGCLRGQSFFVNGRVEACIMKGGETYCRYKLENPELIKFVKLPN